jgi:hypothetical protein
MALSAARNTTPVGAGGLAPLLSWAIADNVKCYEGGVVVASAGYAQPATAATGLTCLGVALKTVDNTVSGHTLGALQVPIQRGQFWLANSSAGDAIAAANRGAPCYLVDDQTVALTDSNGTRSLAGTVIDVSSTLGVLVELGVSTLDAPQYAPQYPQFMYVINVPALSALANAQSLKFTPGIAGRLLKAQFNVTTAVTTGAKAATLTPKIATVATTGGVMSLTSANCTPIGAEVDGTAITGANTFTAAQQLSVDVSAVTAFIEGAGQIVLTFG